jgi:uncharacterized protein DUF3606
MKRPEVTRIICDLCTSSAAAANSHDCRCERGDSVQVERRQLQLGRETERGPSCRVVSHAVSRGDCASSVIKGGCLVPKKTTRGRKQDRARVAGGQKYEVRYEAKKAGKSAKRVKSAVKKVGTSRKKVERELGR